MGKANMKNDEVAIDNDLNIPEVDANDVTPTWETVPNLIS